MTRLFLHGRTETVRPVTMESAAFVKAMVGPNVSVRGARPRGPCSHCVTDATGSVSVCGRVPYTGQGARPPVARRRRRAPGRLPRGHDGQG